jgi:shikimate kinase
MKPNATLMGMSNKSNRFSRIILIGFMGSGKSFFGRHLAKRLGWRFQDCDALIEKEAQASITKIFAKNGEAYFRRLETRVLKRALKKKQMVLATGGGAVLRSVNRRMIRESGVVVWIRASFETILKRVRHKSHRPLLNVKFPKRLIVMLMKKRNPYYRQLADVSIRNSTRLFNPQTKKFIKSFLKNSWRSS